MNGVSREDLKTILLFAAHIAKLDNSFDVWEKRILRRFANTMHLSQAEKHELAHRRASLIRSLQSLSSTEARQLLVKTLCAVSYVDGTAGEAELEFIEKVVMRLDTQVFILPKEEWGQYENEVFDSLERLTATEASAG